MIMECVMIFIWWIMCKNINEIKVEVVSEVVKKLINSDSEKFMLHESTRTFSEAMYKLGWEVDSTKVTHEFFCLIYRHPDYDFAYIAYGDAYNNNLYVEKLK